MVAKLLRFLGVAALASLALAACPNKCSGHGTCGPNDICTCQQNWINADCSGRQCPFTRAWQDTALYSNDAHYYAECGGRGQCDRATGICNCDADFTGAGCRRMRCPGDCNGHGVCLYIEELAVLSTDPRIGGNAANTYTLWDREKIQGCRCDPGWEGYNCLSRVCPKGDDPLTVNDPSYPSITQVDMTQGIAIWGTAFPLSIVLKYTDPYGNIWSTSAITMVNVGEACGNIQTALRQIPNLALFSTTLSGEGQVTVTAGNIVPLTRSPVKAPSGTYPAAVPDVLQVGYHDKLLATCIVSFPAGSGTSGYQYPLACDVAAHPGPGAQPFQASGGTTTACTVYEHYPGAVASPVTYPFTELATCSNRGVCDSSRGECQCFTGHKGLACDLQEALV